MVNLTNQGIQKVIYNKNPKILGKIVTLDLRQDMLYLTIFLDVACFFVGTDKDYVAKILDGCGFFPEIGINILIQRSLITIDSQNKISMHDLIRDMGREIIRENSPDHPGKRSRVWFLDDVLHILNKQRVRTIDIYL